MSEENTFNELMRNLGDDIVPLLAAARKGISSHWHQLDDEVVFNLNNEEEVHLTVKEINVRYQSDEALSLTVSCTSDFENVLKLAKKINMKVTQLGNHLRVELAATPEFLALFNDQIVELNNIPMFFETLDEIKRPIFLNLNHYLVEHIGAG